MHCPKCGAPAAEHQKFCRGCGFGLEKVAHLLDESSPSAEENIIGNETSEKLPPLLNRMEQLWYAGVGVFGAGFVIAICWAIIAKVMIEKGQVISGGLFLAFFLGLITLGLSGLYIESRRKKLAQQQKRSLSAASQSAEILNANTTNRLLPEPDLSSAASVTEETTAKLAEKINAAR